MSVVKAGDRIAVHYRAFGEDGRLTLSSEGRPPLTMTAGSSDVIVGLSHGVVGMQVGERRRLQLAPERAFGSLGAAVERRVPRDRLPAGVQPGDLVRLSVSGMEVFLWVLEDDGEAWRVSTQHPLSGQTVRVEVELVAIADPSS